MKKTLIFFLTILSLSACFKNNYLNSPKLKLVFETDTLFFDTIFTQVGSATRMFKVYNPYSSPIKIDRIFLAGGKNSDFRLNINGQPTLDANNIIIPAKDSIYIFADVTVTPYKSNLIDLDSVVFDIAGNLQNVKLLAVGWPVHLLKRQVIDSSQTWDSQMPYLIFDYLIVDSNACLTVNPGTQIFLHRGSVFYVLGCLKTQGTLDSPVVFSTDRLEKDYQDIPGQWGAIVLDRNSSGNSFEYTEIRNSVVGLSIDSVQDTVNIFNCKIMHQSYANIFASTSNLKIYNCLLADAGWYNLGLIKGGNYQIIGSTVANYYGWGTIRTTPAVAVTNYAIMNNQVVFWKPIKVSILNTIIYGNLENELVLSAAKQGENFDYVLSHCLVKTNEKYDCDSCIINQQPQFKDIEKYDFHLQKNSPAINNASISILHTDFEILKQDLDGKSRLTDDNPDIGAYEYEPASD